MTKYSFKNNPLVSIVTPVLNSKDSIEVCIKSVLNQNYPNIEYIIIDGVSTDGTLDIIQKYKSRISKIVSEPDQGIFDAMNKGVKAASGEIVAILNSDDFYKNKKIVSDIVLLFKKTDADACYGDIKYFRGNRLDKVTRVWKAGFFSKEKVIKGWAPPHPAFFTKRNLFEKYGFFRTDLPVAADYEIMLRFILKGIKLAYIPKTITYMKEGGNSGKFKNRIKGWREIRKSWVLNGAKPPILLIFFRIFSKVHQLR